MASIQRRLGWRTRGRSRGRSPASALPLGPVARGHDGALLRPGQPRHDSYSIVNLQSTTEERAVEAPVRRLSSITRELGHDHVDLLKIDIEGAEHAVLASMLDDGLDVRQICVEFDQPTPMARMIGTVQRLQIGGFTAVARRGWEWTFARDPR